MKGKLHPRNDVTINTSGNESIRDVIARVDAGRRQFLKSSLSASVTAAVAGTMGGAGLLGYAAPVAAAPIPPSANGFGGIGAAAAGVEKPSRPALAAATDPLSDDFRNW